jgi:hypothetical protein
MPKQQAQQTLNNFQKTQEPVKKQDSAFSFLHQSMFPSGVIKPRHLVASSIIANGDMFYSDGTNFVKIPVGAEGKTLKIVNGVPAWA